MKISKIGEPQVVGNVPPLESLIHFNGYLYYDTARDDEFGRELWRTDGTVGGGRIVKDIRIGTDHSDPRSFLIVNSALLFTVDDGIHGRELWQSDGTGAGTRLVMDINPGPAESNIQHMTVFNDMLVFSADDGVHGQELWAFKPNPSASLDGDMWLHYADE